jgi:hypothetical protein
MRIKLLEQLGPSDSVLKNLRSSIGQYYSYKIQDPNYPELSNDGNGPLPYRSGNQDTPMKPRHRKYFNAPLGATQGKIGWGQPLGSWPHRKQKIFR